MTDRASTGIPITLKGCSKSFGAHRVLEPIDLAIEAGETIVLLGPSGCGKTTTLRMIAGLEFPDPGGSVLFGARDVTRLPIEDRRVGMVFQSYALFPNMTVAENVGFGLRVRKVPRREREARVEEMLALVHIEPLANRTIDRLSGGQKQRVALARALAARPEILLLDEPLTALDAKLRDSLRVEIDKLLRSLSITSVYVTHDQAEAMALADRIVVMNAGRIEQIGSPKDIYFRSQSSFVASFIGTMNTIPAVAADGMLRLQDGTMPWSGPTGPLQISFRPQDVQLAGSDAHLRGRVVSFFFLGDRTRAVIAGETFGEIVVELGNDIDLRPDDGVGLSLIADRVRAVS